MIGVVIIGMLLLCTEQISDEDSIIEYRITIPIKFEFTDSVSPIKYFVSRIKDIGYSGEEEIDTLWNSQLTFSIHDVIIDSVYFELVLWDQKGKLIDTLINIYGKDFLIEARRSYRSYTCDTILVSDKKVALQQKQ